MAKRSKVKPCNDDNIHLQKFSNTLDSLTGRKSAATVFSDFLKIAAISLSNTFDVVGKCT